MSDNLEIRVSPESKPVLTADGTDRLSSTDQVHLTAAEGWIELGDYAAANTELQRMTLLGRAHPDTLQASWHLNAYREDWPTCFSLAIRLTKYCPERLFGWIHAAHSLDKLGRTAEAKDLLSSVRGRFKHDAVLPYYLARFCCSLGQLAEAKQWLGRSLASAASPEELALVERLIGEDPVLRPLLANDSHIPG